MYSTEVLFSRIRRNAVALSEEDAVKALTEVEAVNKYISIETNLKEDDKLYYWFRGKQSFDKFNIAGCVIASSWNGAKWLRSTESLVMNLQSNFNENKTPVVGSAFGLDFAYGLGLWTNTNTSMVTSDKLLNGGKLEADPDSFRPVG